MATNPSRRNRKDIEELENSFQKLSGKPNKKRAPAKYAKKSGGPVIGILTVCICLLAVAAIIGGIFIVSLLGGDPTVKANISIMGVDVKGMTQTELVDALNSEFQKLYSATPITLVIDDQTIELMPQESGISLDAEGAAKAALNYKQSSRKKAALDISNYIFINEDALNAILDETALSIDSDLVETQYEITGNAPENLDAIDDSASQVLKVTIGTPGKKLEKDVVLEKILSACSNGENSITYNCPVSDPEPLDLQAIFDQHCSNAIEAEFEDKTYKVLGGTFGYAFDMKQVTSDLANAAFGQVMEFPFHWSEPETTKDELNSQLFRDELSTYTTTQSSDWNRRENLRLACAAINNVVLYPGDVFSYNGTLGERTTEKGYKPGAAYVGGQTVMDVGGGICQVSSSLYYCTVLADLEIVERDCHTYASSYTPLSTDATVYWGGIDYKFKNNSEYPIRIEAESDGGTVTVRLIGTDTKDYYVKFESVHLDTYSYDVIYKEMPEDNPEGYSDGKVITSPYTGYKSEGWSVKYDKETDEEISRTKISTDVYHTRDKVVVKIIKTEETEPETEPETTPETEPETTPETEPETEPDIGGEGGGNEEGGSEDGGSKPIELPVISG